MKNLFSLFSLAVLVITSMASCSKSDGPTQDSGITEKTWVSSEQVTSVSTSLQYSFTAAGNWTAQSSATWCVVVTSSGTVGRSSLSIDIEENTGTARTATITVNVSGRGTPETFTITQAGSGGGGSDAVNDMTHKYLQEKYLWNDEYKTLSPNFSLKYDEFVRNTLMSMKTNTLDKKTYTRPDGSTYEQLYSYIVRQAVSTMQYTKGGIVFDENHPNAEKTITFGFYNMILVSFRDGTYGFAPTAVHPNTPADAADIKRGEIIVTINGKGITESNMNELYSKIMYPSNGETISITKNEPNAQPISITAKNTYNDALIHASIAYVGTSKIGYIVYSGFDAGYDASVLSAFEQMKSAGITDIIIDLRMNGGGHVISSNMISTCVAGSASNGKVYQYYRYNDERMKDYPSWPAENFYYGNYYGVDLRNYAMDLASVYVICSEGTASASEAVINSLKGIDIPVTLIGSKTNGKNVGMEGIQFTKDGYVYEFAPITFQGYNAKKETVNPAGIEVDYPVDDWTNVGYYNFGDYNEPCFRKAVSLITGIVPSDTKTASKAPVNATIFSMPNLKNHISGAIVLPQQQATIE